jgi:hypothetical protein
MVYYAHIREEGHKMKKVRFALYLDARQIKQLEEESGRTGAPVAELIRRAIATQYPYPSKKEGKK